MAAITYWVDPVSGNDANAGTSFATALQTLDGAHDKMVAAGDGNDFTVNVTNTGTHTYDATLTQVDGQTNSTFTFQGTDSSGNDALATITPDGTVNGTTASCIKIRENAGITVRHLKWDASANATSCSFLWTRDPRSGTIDIKYCWFIHSDSTADSASKYVFNEDFAATSGDVSISYCYFDNFFSIFVDTGFSGAGNVSIDHCVFTLDHDGGGAYIGTSCGPDITFTNCTYWAKPVAGVTTSGCMNDGILSLISPTSGTQGACVCKNNVLWKDIGDDWASSLSAAEFFEGGAASTAVVASEDIGYNLFLLGPNLETEGQTAQLLDYDGNPWVTGGDDLYPNDQRVTNLAATTAFNDPDSTYAWTPEGSTVTITIRRDLRLISYLTAGEGGTLPGALPAANVDPSIAGATYDSTTVLEGDRVTVTFTYTEDSGNNDSGTTVSVSWPTQFTRQKTKVTSGSFDTSTKVWTIGSLALGGTASISLTFRVNTSVVGETSLPVVGTITAHGSGIALGGTTSDDAATVTFGGLTIEDTPDDVVIPDAPARVPWIDVVPYTEPRFELAVNHRLRTRRNRSEENYLRHDEEGVLFSEWRSVGAVVTTNTSLAVNLGGIERASYLMLESDVAVQLSVNGGSFLPAAKQWSLSQGQFSSLKIKNPSTTAGDDAQVVLVVVD